MKIFRAKLVITKFLVVFFLAFTATVQAGTLAQGVRAWEIIPSVIRSDGQEAFYFYVNTNGPVSSVSLINATNIIDAQQQSGDVVFRDDGQGGDKVANDYIFTAGPFWPGPQTSLSAHLWKSDDSPAGLDFLFLGTLVVTEQDGSQSQFLLQPYIGVLDSAIPQVTIKTFNESLQATAHVINVKTDAYAAQGALRNIDHQSNRDVGKYLYDYFPDEFDFLIFLSSNKVELAERTATYNFTSGQHNVVSTPYRGTGQAIFANNALWGSAGKLLGVSTLDFMNRGLRTNNLLHELLHQWAAYLDPTLGLTANAHYLGRNNIGSLLGATIPITWTDNGDGTFTFDCSNYPSGGPTRIAPLDRYLMGLLPADQVPLIYTYSSQYPAPLFRCGEVINDFERIVTMQEIQTKHGVRTPGPDSAQRDFKLAFVSDSYNRLLTPTEMTFFDILARTTTNVVAQDQPAPQIKINNWVPITRYFGEDTSWSSEIPLNRPSRPQQLIGRAKRNHVNLVWQASENVEDYAVYRAVLGSNFFEPYTKIATSTNTVLVDDMPEGTVVAVYYVIARNSFGISSPSDKLSIQPTTRIRR